MLLNKVQGQRSDWEYPFAVAGINVSFMLVQMLDLKSSNFLFPIPLYTYLRISHFVVWTVIFMQVFHLLSMEFVSLNCLDVMRTPLTTCTVWPFGCLMLSGLWNVPPIWNSMLAYWVHWSFSVCFKTVAFLISYFFGFVVPGGLEINKNSAGAGTGSRWCAGGEGPAVLHYAGWVS